MWKRNQDGRLLGLCVGIMCLHFLQADLERPATVGMLAVWAFSAFWLA